MNPILILRTEIVCLILLIYLAFISRTFRMGKDGKHFNLIMTFAMVHVILDGYTVWTVNHLDTTPLWVNNLAHIIFILSAVFFAAEVLEFVTEICHPALVKAVRIASAALAGVFLILTAVGVLSIEYAAFNGTNSCVGGAPAAGFALCFAFFLLAIAQILRNPHKVGKHMRRMLLPMLILLMAAEVAQLLAREFLFTGAAITVITVGFFFSLENPATVLEKRIMQDALSGLGSRSSYEHDIQAYDAEFQQDRTIDFTFAFIDINNLRSVNGLYGHEEGDAYIGRIAALLTSNLRNAKHIYRMGGDEFLVVYRGTDEKTVVRDIRRLNDACMRETEPNGYHPELAIGYAVSDTKYNSLRDVLRVADYMMYRNKTALKRESAVGLYHGNGTRLNLYGLTDRVFDAMCLTSEEFYPYMTNLETDVTRVAPGMADFFGLEGEFIQGFHEIWMSLAHPADRDAAEQDIRATLKGLKDYHFHRYRVRGKDGTYVDITCRGGLYHGRDGEPDIFSGYIVNHGAPQLRDPETGLMNLRVLNDRVKEITESGARMTVMRLQIRNLNRVLMLYGAEAVSGAIRSLADHCVHVSSECGEVYGGSERTIVFLLDGQDPAAAEEIFGQIRSACGAGLISGGSVIPLHVCAGAVVLPEEGIRNADDLRSALLYITEESGNSGGTTVLFYRQDAREIRQEDAKLLRAVHHDCLEDRERFFLRLQPILDAQNGKLAGAEALLRYASEEFGEVAPGRFISFLESDPGYTELGYDIIRAALRHAGRIREKHPDFNINVNITALQLYESDFIQRVNAMLEEEHYPAEHLILELTERCKEMEFRFLRERVDALRSAGFRVALDDMGTGFSTIDLLLHLNVNEIKLDKDFTQHIQEHENDSRFTELLVKMTSENSMLLCFEGVETEAMRDYLKQFGMVLLQGYFYDKPLKPEEFEEKYCR